MKNRYLLVYSILLINLLLNSTLKANDEFDFNITEIEISDNGNKIIGKNRGDISSKDGITIRADNFVYDKKLNILNAKGNVIIIDTSNDYKIFSEDISYDKNKNTIFARGTSSAKIRSRFSVETKNLFFLRNEMILNSNNKTTFRDQEIKSLFNLEKFNFSIDNEILKGEKILSLIHI